MTEPAQTKIAYLASPQPDEYIFNVDADGKFQRFALTLPQVANLVADGARMVRRHVGEKA